MLRKILSTIAILIGLTAIHAQTAAVDTLLTAKTADHLSITSSPSSTSITIRNLDNGAETFFYQSGSAKKHRSSFSETQINCPDVKSVVVTETADRVNINFVNSEGTPLSYSFAFADPENRNIKTYIGRRGKDFGFTISRKNTTRWEVVSDGLGFGWVNPIKTGMDMDVSMGSSHEVLWNMIFGLRMAYRSQSLTLGFGFRNTTLTTKGPNHFFKNSDGRITLNPYDDGTTDHKSQISLFSLQLPLLYGFEFGHKRFCKFKIGPVLNFNTGGHLVTRYKSEGREYKIKTSDIGQRKVTVDAMASFNYRIIGVYARYAPMKRFNSRVDLDFGTFSTGLILGF